MRPLILLGALGCTGLFCASGVTTLLGAALVDGVHPAVARAEAPAPHEREARREVGLDALFPPPTGPGEIPVSTPADPQTAPPCAGVRLVGAAAGTRDRSRVLLSSASGTRLFSVGGEVPRADDGATPPWRVESIGVQSVHLRSGEDACQLTMFGTAEEVPATTNPRVAAAATSGRAAPTTPRANEYVIRNVSPGRFEVDDAFATALRERPMEFAGTVRAVPRDGGVGLYGIRRDSQAARLGLQNGDLLRTVNGFDMGNMDETLEAWTQLQTARSFTLRVDRNGQNQTLQYDVR